MPVESERLEEYFKLNASRFGKCLEPGMACQREAIRAHSVQNARVLDLLATNGHVMMIRPRVSKDGPMIGFQSVGRNEASTFTGFCAEHDAALFAPIDTRALDIDNREQLFLLAYRSVTRELHATMEGGVKVQSAYLSRVKRGIEPEGDLSPAGYMATGHLIRAYETWRYRNDYFDEALRARQFDGIAHDVLTLDHQPPHVAVSSLFSLGELQDDDDLIRVVLNVIPLEAGRTLAIFSYAAKDSGQARAALDRIRSSCGAYQKYELSRLILSRIDNFMISPAHFATWNAAKVDRIVDTFLRTLEGPPRSYRTPRLMLF